LALVCRYVLWRRKVFA